MRQGLVGTSSEAERYDDPTTSSSPARRDTVVSQSTPEPSDVTAPQDRATTAASTTTSSGDSPPRTASSLDGSVLSDTTVASAPPSSTVVALARPSFATIDINTMSPSQIARLVCLQTGRRYNALFIHCLLFDSADRTLLIRHHLENPSPMDPALEDPGLHDEDDYCSPHVVYELYNFPCDHDHDEYVLQGSTVDSISTLFRSRTPCSVVRESVKLLCAVETTMSIDDEGNVGQYPVLVLAVGAQTVVGAPMNLPPELCSESMWLTAAAIRDWNGGCRGMKRRLVFAEALRQWPHRDLAFDARNGAWRVYRG